MVNHKVIREYHSDDSFMTRPENISQNVTEYQLCLAYATNSNEGKFDPKWDEGKVTADVIEQFKANCKALNLPVTVFVSIGGDEPFKAAADSDVWISNAKSTLKQIFKKYNITGLDVNYTSIEEGSQYQFVYCIKNLLKKLRADYPDFVASLAPSAATHKEYYLPLYKAIDNTWLGTVVFKCFVDLGFEPLSEENPVQSLVDAVQDIVEKYNRMDTKLLLGYSAIEEDWKIVSPPLFFLALNRLVQLPPRVNGASVKVISDAKACICVTKWTPQFLSLAVADAAPRR